MFSDDYLIGLAENKGGGRDSGDQKINDVIYQQSLNLKDILFIIRNLSHNLDGERENLFQLLDN